MCVCVCVRERERERECVCVCNYRVTPLPDNATESTGLNTTETVM